MRTRATVLLLLLSPLGTTLFGCAALSEDSSASALLERSIRFHDPGGAWTREPFVVSWTSSRPNGQVSFAFDIRIAADGTFSLQGQRSGSDLEYSVQNGVVRARVDGEEELSDDIKNAMGLARDGGFFWRDYLGFLAGLPMCLRVPSVTVEPEVRDDLLEEREVKSILATFSPEVGSDIWTFYFDPETAQLLGCRFDRADASRDGETIVFEGLTETSGIKIPRLRRWYMNADRRFLGTDELTNGVP